LRLEKDSPVNMSLSWDWRNDGDYKNYNGEQIPAPWLQESHIGIDLSEANECQPSDGWRLYIKRMTASDFTGPSSKIKLQSTAPVNPYFVLYNIYTGVMRVFMYLGGENTVGEDYFVVKTSVVDGPGAPADVGIFLNDAGNYSYLLSEKNTTINTDKMEIFNFNAIYKKWIVVDYPVSFDPSLSNYSNKFFNIQIGAVDEEKITIGGSFGFDMQTVVSSDQSLVSAVLDEVYGSSGKIKKRMENVTKFEDNLTAISDELKNEGYDEDGAKSILGDVAEKLDSFANFVDPALDAIGLFTGVLGYVNSFTNIVGGGSTQAEVTVGEGSITLEGVQVDNFTVTEHEFGLPLVQYSNTNERPEFQGPIGIFSLKQKPQVTVVRKQFKYDCRNSYTDSYSQYSSYGLYVQFDDSNMEHLFEVNSASNMDLVEVKAVPIISVTGQFLAPPYWGYYDVVYKEGLRSLEYAPGLSLYSRPSEKHKFMTAYTLPKTPVYNDGYLIAGQDADDFPDQVTTSGLTCRGSLIPQATNVDMKFYLKFENTNDSSIKAEFMRTFEADVTYEEIIEY